MTTRPGFGVEEFINLLMALLRFYERHQDQIDDFISSTHATMFHTLVADMPSLQNVNPEGPNAVPNTEGL